MKFTIKSILLFIFFIPSLVFSHSQSSNDQSVKNLKITQLSDNVYQHTSSQRVEPWGLVEATGLVVVNGTDAHMIDTPWTTKATKELIKWIEGKGLTLKSTVVTHFHSDASNDLPLLNELNIKTYATSLTNKLLKSKKKETANHEITTHAFELVDEVMSVYYPGGGHSQDNIVVWMPQEKILFGGCFVKSLKAKNLGNTEDAVISEWSKSIQNVINRYPDIKLVIPGHGKIGDTRLLTHTQKLALSVQNAKKPAKQ